METLLPGTTPELRFFDATVRYEMAVWSRLERAVSDACGVRLGSFSVLRVLAARRGAGRVQDAAADLGITVGAVSKIVDRLERGGWVRRRPHDSDGRSQVIELTPEGTDLLDRGLAVMAGELRGHLAPVLTAEQLDVASHLLEELTEACTTGSREHAA